MESRVRLGPSLALSGYYRRQNACPTVSSQRFCPCVRPCRNRTQRCPTKPPQSQYGSEMTTQERHAEYGFLFSAHGSEKRNPYRKERSLCSAGAEIGARWSVEGSSPP